MRVLIGTRDITGGAADENGPGTRNRTLGITV